MRDNGFIVCASWFVIGSVLGQKLSLLSLLVRDDSGDERRYVIEKVKSSGPGSERVKNGVYVSHWAAVAHLVTSKPHKQLLDGDMVGSRFTIKALYDVATGLGCDVGGHDATHVLYNHLAKANMQAMRRTVSPVTWILQNLGLLAGPAAASRKADKNAQDLQDKRMVRHPRKGQACGAWTCGRPRCRSCR